MAFKTELTCPHCKHPVEFDGFVTRGDSDGKQWVELRCTNDKCQLTLTMPREAAQAIYQHVGGSDQRAAQLSFQAFEGWFARMTMKT